MAVFVTRLAAEVSHTVVGSAHVTRLQGQVIYGDRTKPLRVTRLQAQIIYSDRTKPVRVTRLQLQVLMSLQEKISPTLLVGGNFFPPTVTSDLVTLIVDKGNLEPNPYQPILPDDVSSGLDPAVIAVFGPQQEMLRKQHNLTQAGDTTFPWDILYESTTDQHYNLGSIGRFLTPDFGIIQAVYVSFNQLDLTSSTGTMPFGRLKTATAVDWIATNDFSKSGNDLVLGIGQMQKLPAEGEYGWLVIRGSNIATLNCGTVGVPSQDDTYTWLATGEIARNGAGRIIAKQWGLTQNFDPGAILVSLEGPSDAELEALFSADFSAIQTAIQTLQQAVTALQNVPSADYADSISKLQQAVALLNKALANEAQARSKRDSELTNLIGQNQVTVEQFNNYKTQVNVMLASLEDELQTQIDALLIIAKASKSITDQLNPGAINDFMAQVSAILKLIENRLTALELRPGPVLPMVIGIPPELLYFPDGSLMYTEI